MKKIILFIFFIIMSMNILKGQIIDSDKVEWDVKNKENLEVSYTKWGEIIIKDSGVSFTIRPRAYTPLWEIQISNELSHSISIIWNEAAMGSGRTMSRIVFGDMNKITMSNKIPNSIIYEGKYLQKDIIGEDYAKNSYMSLYPLKTMKEIYKMKKSPQSYDVDIIIPIMINEEQKVFKITLTGIYDAKRKK